MIIDGERRVAEVRLTRPEVRNAQTMATWHALASAAEIIGARDDIAVVLLRGDGDDFSAGLDLRMVGGAGPTGEGDLAELLRGDDTAVEAAIAGFQRGFSCWRELSAIVVAVITGNAIGAGFQLALAADLRVLTDDAVLTMAEGRLGLVPDLGGTGRLVELVSYPRALEICALVTPIDADGAERLGLANVVWARSELDTRLDRYVDSLLAVDPAISRSLKSLLAGASTRTADDQLVAERRVQLPLLRRFQHAT